MHLLFLFIASIYLSVLSAETTQKSIAIFTYKVLGQAPWDPDAIQSGITGSEEAVIYMAKELSTLGYKVSVLGSVPTNSCYSKEDQNPRYIDLYHDDGKKYDIAISWRMPDASLRLKARAEKVFFWPHDTCHQKIAKEYIDAFDDVLWLSNWQRQQWIEENPGFGQFSSIFGNGITLENCPEVIERENPYSCIYSSNYARGLEILLDIWDEIHNTFPKATLDIYYGWNHWGLLTNAQVEKMQKQIEMLASKGVKEHGLVGHKELTNAYQHASIWAYPCIGLETFCITALRAQAAGAIPVVINKSALKETVHFGFSCQELSQYTSLLKQALEKARITTLDERKKMQEFVLEKYTWKKIAQKWDEVFGRLVDLEKSKG